MPTETRYTRPARTVETGYTLDAQTLDTGYTRAALTVETDYDAQPAAPTAPVNTVAPVVSGTTTEGETLSCTTGTWTGTPPITYTYQWYRTSGPGSTPISGATSSTYLLDAADVGEEVFCIVAATNIAGSDSFASNNVGPIASSGSPPVNTVAPVASGTVRIDEVLSCTTGTWTGAPTPTYAYQWRRDGVDIGGATASTHTVVSADMAAEIDCVVTASNGISPDASEPSNALASPWRPVVAILGADGYFGVRTEGVTQTNGAPVASWQDVTGQVSYTQALTAAQPTRAATSIAWGPDDWMAMPSDIIALYQSGVCTTGLGVEALPVSNDSLRLLSVSDNGTSDLLDLLTSYKLQRNRAGAPSVSFAAASGAKTAAWWRRDGAGALTRRLDGVVSSTTLSSWVADPLTVGALGVRYPGAPSAGTYSQPSLRWWLHAQRVLSDAEIAVIEGVLAGEGLI